MFPWLRDDQTTTTTTHTTTTAPFAVSTGGDQHVGYEKHAVSDLHGHTTETHRSYGSVNANTSHHPYVSAGTDGLAEDLVGHGFGASTARITGASEHLTVHDTPEMHARSAHERAEMAKEKAALERHYEDEVRKRTDDYRKSAEAEADKIRKELEHQHARDLQFRKEVIDSAFERQKKELELGTEFARKDLERERQKAMESLEHTGAATDVRVKFDTSAGTTVSEGHTRSDSTSGYY